MEQMTTDQDNTASASQQLSHHDYSCRNIMSLHLKSPMKKCTNKMVDIKIYQCATQGISNLYQGKLCTIFLYTNAG